MKQLLGLLLISIIGWTTTSSAQNLAAQQQNEKFDAFRNEYIDAYAKLHPTWAIYFGYGKYYDSSYIIDDNYLLRLKQFQLSWSEALKANSYLFLTPTRKLVYDLLKDELNTPMSTEYKTDATVYAILPICDIIIHQEYAPLNTRLRNLSNFLHYAPDFYASAQHNLDNPNRRSIIKALNDNKNAPALFLNSDLADSIQASTLSSKEKENLLNNVDATIKAINQFNHFLKKKYFKTSIKETVTLKKEKFLANYNDLNLEISPEQLYEKAITQLVSIDSSIISVSKRLWSKYFPEQSIPKDNQNLVDKISSFVQKNHLPITHFSDSVKKTVQNQIQFVVEKGFCNCTPEALSLTIHKMPLSQTGRMDINFNLVPYFNKNLPHNLEVVDIDKMDNELAQKEIKNFSIFSTLLLLAHEGIPGHSLQSIYYQNKLKDTGFAIFFSNTTSEGWARYAESWMYDNGWNNQSDEIHLSLLKAKSVDRANMIAAYDRHYLNFSKEEATRHLTSIAASISKKEAQRIFNNNQFYYNQWMAFFGGENAIEELLEAYKTKMGTNFSIKTFHETFLSYGYIPIKYIKKAML